MVEGFVPASVLRSFGFSRELTPAVRVPHPSLSPEDIENMGGYDEAAQQFGVNHQDVVWVPGPKTPEGLRFTLGGNFEGAIPGRKLEIAAFLATGAEGVEDWR